MGHNRYLQSFLLVSSVAFGEPIRVVVVDIGFDQNQLSEFISKDQEFQSLNKISFNRYLQREKKIKSAKDASYVQMLNIQRQLITMSHGTNVAKEVTEGLTPKDVQIIPLDVNSSDFETEIGEIPKERSLDAINDLVNKLKIILKTGKISAVNISYSPPPVHKEAREYFKTELKRIIGENPGVLFTFAAGNKGSNLDSQDCNPETSSYLWIGDKDLPKNVVLVGSCKCKVAEKSEFSNFGKNVEIYTSGEQVKYVLPKGWEAMCDEHGTSFAAPRLLNEIIQRKRLQPGNKDLVELLITAVRDRKTPIDSTPIFTKEDMKDGKKSEVH